VNVAVLILLGMFVGWLVAAWLEFDKGIFAHMGFGAMGAVAGVAILNIFTTPVDIVPMIVILWSLSGALLAAGVAGILLSPNKNNGA